jgi:spermidine synthase
VKEKTLVKTRTPHQIIELTALDTGEYAMYLDGAIQFVSGLDDRLYHGILAGIPAKMMQGRPFKALILGGGDGLAARTLLRFPNAQKVHMVELDPGMVQFARQNPIVRQMNGNVFENPKLQVTIGDALKYIAKPGNNSYDIAIIDFPDPLNLQLEKLFDREVYDNVYINHMNQPKGVFSIQTSGAYSDTEDKVREHLQDVTGTETIPIHFMGNYMLDGSIVYGGPGMVAREARIADRWKASRDDAMTVGDVF